MDYEAWKRKMSQKISLVVPAYNIESEIERCIRSIQVQTYGNIEIVCVDDGSSDRTLEILRGLESEDMRIRVIEQDNSGVTRARLAGVAASTGDWVGFVDGDDYVEPDMFERLYRNACQVGADISHCGYRMVYPDREYQYYNTGKRLLQDTEKGLIDLLEGRIIEPGLWNKLFKRELFNGLLSDSVMDTSIKNTEDLLMNYYLFRESKSSVYEDFCPYHYLVRKDSAANRSLNEHLLMDPIRVSEILLKETKDSPVMNAIAEKKYIRNLISLSTRSTYENEELIRPFQKKARRELRKRSVQILLGNKTNLKLKLMVFWVSVWPASYGWIHMLYAKVTGLDKYYEIK